MRTRRQQWPRPLRIGLVALAAGLAVSSLAGTAAGAPPDGAHPQDDQAGSTIARREQTPDRGTLPLAVGPGIKVPAGVPQGSAPGLDVSAHQGTVDWHSVVAGGAVFAYVKASEGTGYQNPYFDQQYGGATQAGLIHGAYHFALPDQSDGAAQANYFLDRSGWSKRDKRALPPALDIEYNPYGDRCYGMRPDAMIEWIRSFSRTVRARTGWLPMIYTSTNWWKTCTGNNNSFGAHGLWLPHYGSSVGELPAGWDFQTFWQFADNGPLPGDQDSFNGSTAQLGRLIGL